MDRMMHDLERYVSHSNHQLTLDRIRNSSRHPKPQIHHNLPHRHSPSIPPKIKSCPLRDFWTIESHLPILLLVADSRPSHPPSEMATRAEPTFDSRPRRSCGYLLAQKDAFGHRLAQLWLLDTGSQARQRSSFGQDLAMVRTLLVWFSHGEFCCQ